MTRLSALLIAVFAAGGCSETEQASRVVSRSDPPADIRCTSYGEVTFRGRSTGRVRFERSGRISFVDAATGRLNFIDGECRIVYSR